jgi:hypothetical protein
MAKITDVIPPTIVSNEEFAAAMNEASSYRTESGRMPSLPEVAVLKIRRIEQQLRDVQAALEQLSR